jgi:phosphatidylserine/phosphatidylglycerophosphate/cardiolipin synthase-like enzyme
VITTAGSGEAVDSVGRARSILLTAYVLREGRMLDALEAAARRGAAVTVRVEGHPYGDSDGTLTQQNASAVAELRALGADAAVTDADGSGPAMHMKALVCDGVAYLDDRNWPDDGQDTILRDDFSSDVRAIEDAALGRRPAPGRWFATTKAQALWSEARLLYAAGRGAHVDVESESFGVSPTVYAALKRLASRRVHCRLLVAQRDLNAKSRQALGLLAKAGVEIRVGDFDEKMAVVDGERAWTGSANSTATYYDGNQIDWGVRTDAPDVVRTLQSHFDAHWNAASPLAVT